MDDTQVHEAFHIKKKKVELETRESGSKAWVLKDDTHTAPPD